LLPASSRFSPLPVLGVCLALAACDTRDPVPQERGPGAAEFQAPTQARTLQPAGPPLRCADDGWTTYAHDAARTGTSAGCLFGPLRASWTFAPKQVDGTPSHAARVVATADGVFATGGIGPTPTIWRLNPATGAIVWRYVTMADATRDGWPTLAPGKVMLIDDGVYSIDAQTGHGHRGEFDAWGESLTDGERLYAENNRYWDGYGLSVSAFDLEARKLWRRDYQALVRFYTPPDVGGVAMADGRLVHAAQHGPLATTGLSAFDPGSSERVWRIAVSPQSSPSIADGLVFTVESSKGEAIDRLAARSLADGTLAWERETADAHGPAPLLARGMVIVHARKSVTAYDRRTGAPAWSTQLPRTADAVQSATTMAAAEGSGTLVVLSGRTIHLLDLTDGRERSSLEVAPHAKRLEGPVVAGGAVYVVADGMLVRFEDAAVRDASLRASLQ